MNERTPFLHHLPRAERSCEGGIVYLVGAGPGDPELLTLRAARVLAQADAVVVDHLVSGGILAMIDRKADVIYAGKEKDKHTLSQSAINALLVRLARQGKRVVRLKGGDPFIFGRGGEEAEALAACGIRFEVVPGITAACGIACYTGIPLTHRDHAQSCLFTTGHLKDGTLDLDWEALLRPRQTVVIYMGLGALHEIARELIARGQRPDMPAAAIEHGTTGRQRIANGTLATLPCMVVAMDFASPCLSIIGEVVALHESLRWFDAAAAAGMTAQMAG